MNNELSISEEIEEAFMRLDDPIGDDVNGDYGRADGKWHREVGTNRMVYAVETICRIADREILAPTIVGAAAIHGFGLVPFEKCAKCGETALSLPVYGTSGGYGGRDIFYLTAPAPNVNTKASE